MVAPPSPLRVVHIVDRLDAGGPGRHVTALVRGLAKESMRCTVLHGGAGEWSGRAGDGTARIEVAGIASPTHPWRAPLALVALSRAVTRLRPHVIHTHGTRAGLIGRVAAWLARSSMPNGVGDALVVHTVHGRPFDSPATPRHSRAARRIERLLAPMTDRLLVVSPHSHESLRQIIGQSTENSLALVPQGFELDDLLLVGAPDPQARRSFGFGSDDFVMTFVGPFVARKDLPTMMRAFASIYERAPNARLLLVGDGVERNRLERLAGELQLRHRIVFAGVRRDLDRVYRATDVAVLTSTSERTPVSVIRAMAAGRPVVATQVGHVPDIVRDRISGLVVAPGQPAQVAGAILRLRENPRVREELGAAARLEAMQDYSLGRLVSLTAQFYRQGLADRCR